MTETPTRNRRVIGRALLAGAGLMVVLAVLFAAGIIPFPPESRTLVVGLLAAVAVVDALIGLRFLQTSAK